MRRSSRIAGSASLTNSPRTNAGACSVNRAVVGDGLADRPALRPPDREVVGAEGGREVDDARAVLHRDEVRRRPRCARPRRWGTGARSASPTRLGPRTGRHDGPVRRRGRARAAARRRPAAPRRGRPARTSASAPTAAPVFDGSVHGVVVHTASEAPTSVRVGRLHDREPHEHARVLDLLVALRDLGVGQRRAAPRAVRGDLVSSTSSPRSCSRFSDHHTDSM